MGRALTPKERDAKKRTLFDVLEATASRAEVCPTLDQLGKLTRTSGSTIGIMLEELQREGLIRFWFQTAAMVGTHRMVQIIATGAKTTMPGRRRVPAPNARYKRDRIDADTREDVEAREHKIYGGILDDVNWLRHRGWVIHREKGGFRVGNQLIDAQAVVEKAARERRLATLTY